MKVDTRTNPGYMARPTLEDTFCVADLKKERANNCSFNQEEITNLLDGGSDNTQLRRELEEYFLSDPSFVDPVPPEYLSHEDKYENEVRKAVAALSKLNEENEMHRTVAQVERIRLLISSSTLGAAINKDGNPMSLHYVMFIPAILGHCTVDQQTYWMSRAWAGEIIGTYAQTELGHGTFLRGLETTATYDPSSEEFILHSPTITSLKWWPGGLGKTANYAVVMAQLYIGSMCYGPHPFMVQLRDEETHKPLDGITIGEIGPRLGMNTADNGFLRFSNFRIPRMNMLMRHAQVLKDGTYVSPKSTKLTYGTMVFVRVTITFDAMRQLQRAVTIATRYSAVRHQSELIPGEPEPQILDYQTQQYKLLPQISSVFALAFAGRYIWDSYHDVAHSILEGNLDTLPELHALSCGLKAQSTHDCSIAIDICRRACGGHGYMASSNLPRIFTAATAAQTYEGENTVMWLQLSRYMMKIAGQSSVDLGSSFHYFSPSRIPAELSDLSDRGLVKKWQNCVLFQIDKISEKLKKLQDCGMPYELAWNDCSITLVKCAQTHIRSFICEQYVKNLEQLENVISHPTLSVLHSCCRLYLLYYLQEDEGCMMKCGVISEKQLATLEEEMYELLKELRPLAVPLVDSFDIHDKILGSTLGAWDGNVYERLYKEAQQSVMNKKDVPEAFHKYLKPFMKSKL